MKTTHYRIVKRALKAGQHEKSSETLQPSQAIAKTTNQAPNESSWLLQCLAVRSHVHASDEPM